MHKVLVTDKLADVGLDYLHATNGIDVAVRSELSAQETREALKTADGIIIRSGTKLTRELLRDQPRLKVIVRAGVGVDNIDLPAATREGIVVMNTPAGNTTSTAEHTIAMLMALSRNIGPASVSMREGKWDRKKFTGTQLASKDPGRHRSGPDRPGRRPPGAGTRYASARIRSLSFRRTGRRTRYRAVSKP